MTKTAFLAALEGHLQQWDWARDKDKLAKFMDRTRDMLRENKMYVSIDGPAFAAAWKDIGGKGRLTYKALFALPA